MVKLAWLAPSSNGLGRQVLILKTEGSNPSGVTNISDNLFSPCIDYHFCRHTIFYIRVCSCIKFGVNSKLLCGAFG
jgi:hypothetical protein